VRQGHYASEPGIDSIDPPPDLSIERIGDLLDHDLSEFFLPLRQCAPLLRSGAGFRRRARMEGRVCAGESGARAEIPAEAFDDSHHSPRRGE